MANFAALASLALMAVASSGQNHSEMEAVYQDKSYGSIRTFLLRELWSPDPKSEQDGCTTFKKWCAERQEMHYCQIVGPIARCLYVWIRGDEKLSIVTVVDDDVIESIFQEKVHSVRSGSAYP